MDKGKAIEQFVKYMVITNMSLGTIETYERDVRLFLLSVKEEQADKINRNIIENYLAQLAVAEIKDSVIKKKYASLKAFFRFLGEQKIILANPLAKPIRIPKNLKPAKLLIKPADIEEITMRILLDGNINQRDKLIIHLVLLSGLSLVNLTKLKVIEAKKLILNPVISTKIRQEIEQLLGNYIAEAKDEHLFLSGRQQLLTYKFIRQLVLPFIAHKVENVKKSENFYLKTLPQNIDSEKNVKYNIK